MINNEKENKVMGEFFDFASEATREDEFALVWKDGKIIARLDTFADDEDEETGEEYNSAYFELISKTGNVPEVVDVLPGRLFEINYHNYPDHVYFNGREIAR